MDPQFDPNWTTWYVIIPILVIGLAALVWFIVKMHVTLWKRVALGIVSLFAFMGFAAGVLCVYYRTNDAFNAMFKYYAYTKLAPDSDPFAKPDGSGIISVLGVVEVSKKDGLVQFPDLRSRLGFDYVGAIFTPGKWQFVKVVDRVMTAQNTDSNGQPDVINTSLWWALRYDPFHYTASAQ